VWRFSHILIKCLNLRNWPPSAPISSGNSFHLAKITPFSCFLAIISPLSRQHLAMNRPIKREWLEPFRQQPELEAQAYEKGFEPRLPRRTALNRLGRLREAGLVERQGEARSTIYRLTDAGRSRLEGDRSRQPVATPSQGLSPLPPEVEAVRVRLQRPVTERPPVGYQRSLLDSYQPNQTFYLPESARRKLIETGSQTGMAGEAAGTYARHICQRLLIDLSWNSSRLEGNTYSLLETEQLFQGGRSGDAHLSNEAVMILNHKAAIEFLLESSSEAGFNRRTILNLHALLTADLLRDPASEGALRTDPVGIGKSSYLPPAIPALIETLFDQILAKADEIRDPYEQAFFVMVHLPYLQPFIDGNKRVSRLTANLPLFQRNLAPLSFVDVSETDYTDGMLAIYELNDLGILREVFIQAYERSAQRYTVIRGAVGDPDPFRVKYRQAITEQVAEIIRARCARREAVARLRRWAEDSVIEKDRKAFVAAAEETLAGIHEGNFARYRIRPSEFEEWQAAWNEARD
jgi:fido (protein-threonine AMPylation protein)/DNA-binding transcriptional ArsR family regulator